MPDHISNLPILSICQPWAFLVVTGEKDVENRSWMTHYRGRILIHASKTMTQFAADVAHLRKEGVEIDTSKLVVGKIIGSITVKDIKFVGADDEHPSDWWSGAEYVWELEKGPHDGLWEPSSQMSMQGKPGLFYL